MLRGKWTFTQRGCRWPQQLRPGRRHVSGPGARKQRAGGQTQEPARWGESREGGPAAARRTRDAHPHQPVVVAMLLRSGQCAAEEQAQRRSRPGPGRGAGEWGGSAVGGKAGSISPSRPGGCCASSRLSCRSLTAPTGLLPCYFQVASV